MKTQERFYKPGIEPVDQVIQNLPNVPRKLHSKGIWFSVVWRVLCFVLISVSVIYFIHLCFIQYIETASFFCWFLIVSIIPLWLLFLPWKLISSYRNRIRSFRYCQKIYENGIPVPGTVNTLTRISGYDQNCHHIEHKWSSSLSKVRIDFTFVIDNTVKTGTATLREQNMNYLSMNSDICVLYLPDNPAENMIYPIPGNEFFDYLTNE